MSSLIHRTIHNSPRVQRTSVALVVLTSLAAFALRANAQAPAISNGPFELRPYVGAFIPTGDQRDLLKDAVLVGGQASWRFAPALALTGTVGWSPSKDKLTAGNQTIDLVQYDIGLEARAAGLTGGGSWNFTPFAGIGVGGRTYSFRDLDVDSKTNFDGYGALGGEFGLGRVGLRIEARDYVSRFKPFTGTGETATRNDIALAAGLTLHFP
ncbi:MAG: outer membrane beta-barrel protein [bacterium]